jgi:transcriptional regulator GlxA family with amidase domain
LDALRKAFDKNLPTIGVILFDDVLMTEVTAPIDVFSKLREDGTKLFNVVTVAETIQPVSTESGLRILPDYTFDDCPALTVLVVPSAYDMTDVVLNGDMVAFVKRQNANTSFTMSNCAGSQLIGESGIADGRRIVTYIGGGAELQRKYPALTVQDDQTISFVEDGKFLSSNGNLASYISALELLEKMSDKQHRQFVESYLYLERLTGWDNSKRRPE